jgi:hypothetical protein
MASKKFSSKIETHVTDCGKNKSFCAACPIRQSQKLNFQAGTRMVSIHIRKNHLAKIDWAYKEFICLNTFWMRKAPFGWQTVR